MAERGRFELPIAFRLCLISSQVHSTGLCHLSVFVAPQIRPGHNEFTGKGMAVAMPRIALDLPFFECGKEPAARSLQRLASPDGREDRFSRSRLGCAAQLSERAQSDRVQWKCARISVLG